ncbi:hypothetical protein B5X24_HaOG216386 [Helicoverpa armigera]|nr:hypothetical protein B5X24_HaOG216386 [Helicoverpa armigera]
MWGFEISGNLLLYAGEGDRGGERRRGAGAAVSRGMRRRPLLPLLLLALLRAHGLLAASGESKGVCSVTTKLTKKALENYNSYEKEPRASKSMRVAL